MPKFNRSFELTIADVELIETALQKRKKDLSLRRLSLLSNADAGGDDATELQGLNAALGDIHDLLGRLHNQKIFYRPDAVSNAPYVSG
ncbi:MAG: hypothetical protein NXH82_14155 [Rhodobacteraceae bacterium]|nr:hypothetical protein [Paracoccaceae bacterium]